MLTAKLTASAAAISLSISQEVAWTTCLKLHFAAQAEVAESPARPGAWNEQLRVESKLP